MPSSFKLTISILNVNTYMLKCWKICQRKHAEYQQTLKLVFIILNIRGDKMNNNDKRINLNQENVVEGIHIKM